METWRDIYAGGVQSVYAPMLVPGLFLLWRRLAGRRGVGLVPAAARFVDAYAMAVAVETAVDLLATGPLLRGLGIAGAPAGTAIMLSFVLLGDFRVYLLVFALRAIAGGRSWTAAIGTAAACTLLVPAIAYPADALLHAQFDTLGERSIWLVYEITFAVVALALRARLRSAAAAADPALGAYLSAVLLYVAGYYGLWAAADVLIQLADLDAGWALRIVPNQLYYAFWAPFVYWRFFGGRRIRRQE